ncbi:unnamed protein product, partial [Mesorhabditis belari]|uniref:Phosphoserine aminotransferase n=1 Tax=Mesorhabditis belari TaxID=2138241 RepID=A0AAF3EGG2_9BILA
MTKKINFGAGPAKIPEEVMEKAASEFIHFGNTGVSILEMSHRSADFTAIIEETKALLRDLMQIPDNYEVLFMHGGGTGQFAAVPLNLKRDKTSADYLVTGSWSDKAFKEAQKYLDAKRVTPAVKPITRVPPENEWTRDPDAAYLYYCANETIHGIEFFKAPETLPGVPLVADISSTFLSRPFDFTNHGVVLGGTQKNLGAAGLTVAIVRKDLIGHELQITPSVLSYKIAHDNNSVYNTPSVYSIYITNLVLKWIKEKGGAERFAQMNQEKASLIYSIIDDSNDFFYCPIDKEHRSLMNIPFRIGGSNGDDKLEKEFLVRATEKKMIGLKGHRSVGGIRASLYNAITLDETKELAELMKEFQKEKQQ